MTKIDKPSDVNNIKEHKLTKRRLIKALSAAGFSGATLGQITVDDVKGADSDQVPISLTTDGENKTLVSSDWYDKIVHAREVFDKMENKWMERDSVSGVWLAAGDKGGENPFIVVQIERSHPRSDETRGEIPERKNGVLVGVEEHVETETASCPDGDAPCSSYDSSSFSNEIPGGPKVHAQGAEEDNAVIGSLSCQMQDVDGTYRGYIMTAGHVPGCERGLPATNQGKCIGGVVEVNQDVDVAIIEPDWDDDIDPIGEVAEVSDISGGARYRIDGTATKDGVQYWDNNNKKLFKYGAGSCYSQGEIQAIGTTDTYHTCDSNPEQEYPGQLRWGDSDHAAGGDSGAITFGAAEDGDGYWAFSMINATSGLHQPELLRDYVTGISGYYLDNNYDWYWD